MVDVVSISHTYLSIITEQEKILFKEGEGNKNLKGCGKISKSGSVSMLSHIENPNKIPLFLYPLLLQLSAASLLYIL